MRAFLFPDNFVIIKLMTILIKNIQLLDGTGRPPVKADVLVKNEKISAVGNFPKYRADEIIDGLGNYLAPGFIDINAASDRYLTLFSNPDQKDSLLQGATTLIGGQGGFSLAPLIYGSLEAIREWADVGKVNVSWHTLAEFLKAMDRRPLGVNFGTLVGHITVRHDLVGENSRDLSRNELRVFNLLLEKSLREGAFGFSAGLNHRYSRQTSYSEIKALAETTAKLKGLYAVFLRNEKNNLLSSVSETIAIAKETNAKVLINHLRPLIGSGKDYEEALELIDKNTDKADIFFGVCPFNVSAVLISSFLPDWAQAGGRIEMLKDIEAPGLKEKIIKELPRFKGDEVVVVSAPGNEYLVGKSLKEFSQNRDLNVYEGLLALMKLTEFRAVVSYANVNSRKISEALNHNRAIVVSGGVSFAPLEMGRPSAAVSVPKGQGGSLTGFGQSEGFKKSISEKHSYKTFIKFLSLAETKKIMPLGTAIYKITGLPAQRLGLDRRGLIRDGYFADLVIFSTRGGSAIGGKDVEVREVIVNGKRAVKEGKFQNILAGKILRHQ